MLSAMADGAKGDGGGLAVLLATLAGNAFLLLGTLVLATCTLLTGWIPLPGGGRVFFFWARLWGRLVLLTSGVRWRAEHLVALDRPELDGLWVLAAADLVFGVAHAVLWKGQR